MTATTETLSRKRYMRRVFECAACGLLAESSRTHAITCSPTCRVWLHRHPEHVAANVAICAAMKITLAGMLEASAVQRLRPDLAAKIARGEVEVEDVRTEVHADFMRLVFAQTE